MVRFRTRSGKTVEFKARQKKRRPLTRENQRRLTRAREKIRKYGTPGSKRWLALIERERKLRLELRQEKRLRRNAENLLRREGY